MAPALQKKQALLNQCADIVNFTGEIRGYITPAASGAHTVEIRTKGFETDCFRSVISSVELPRDRAKNPVAFQIRVEAPIKKTKKIGDTPIVVKKVAKKPAKKVTKKVAKKPAKKVVKKPAKKPAKKAKKKGILNIMSEDLPDEF